MKTKSIFYIAASAWLTLASCSSSEDDTLPSPQPTVEEEMVEVTGHIKEDKPAAAKAQDFDRPNTKVGTRTTFDNTFSTDNVLTFRWSENDKVYLQNGESSVADFRSSDTKKSYATFKFKRSTLETSTEVPVQYVGTKSATYGKATIAPIQVQNTPNNADHIGESGDCAVANIAKNSAGNYAFTLHHKASFLCFMPYSPKGTYTKLYGITVSADKPLSKDYDLSATGLAEATTISDSQPNYVYLKTGGNNGFDVTTAKSQSQNASIMVIHPQTSALVCVFTVGDKNGKMMNIVKYLPEQTLKANTLHPYTVNLENDYGRWDDHLYYMWDAKFHDKAKGIGYDYWYGHEDQQPTANGQQGQDYPSDNSDNRWYNVSSTNHASNTAYDAMTKNTLKYNTQYYLQNHFSFDAQVYWPMKGVLQHGGMWLTRYSKCTDNLTTNTVSSQWTAIERYDDMVGRPQSNIENFFFLPAMGSYYDGKLESIGSAGIFWMYNANDVSAIEGYKERAYFLSVRLHTDVTSGLSKSYMLMGQNTTRKTGLPILHSYYANY